MQRALIQYRNPKNYDLVLEALKKGGRMDLVGFEKHCLIRPRRTESRNSGGRPQGNGQKKQESRSKSRKSVKNRKKF
jgi:hypothetical protein